MTGVTQDIDESIWTEALDWLLQLNGPEQRPQDAADFAAWLERSPVHQAAYRQAEHVWGLTGALTPLSENMVPTCHKISRLSPVAAAAIQPVTAAAALSRGHRLRRQAIWIGAALAACIVLLLLSPQVMLPLIADYHTPVGGGEDIVLDDGTQISLNAASAITVDYTAKARRVTLLAGEVLVKVAPDKTRRPFSLTSGKLVISDIGTVFDIDAKPGSVTVSVQEGQVSVDYAQGSALLSQDDRVRVDLMTGQMEQSRIDGSRLGAWRSGQLIVDAAPISDVVDELRRYYRGFIVLRGDDIGRQKVSGVFDLKNPIHALQAVAGPYSGQVEQWTPYVTTLSGPPKP